MKQYIKDVSAVFCILFTVLTLIQFFRGEAVTAAAVRGFIGISLFSGVLIFLLQENEKLSRRRLLFNQIGYVTAILIMIAVITYYSGWELSPRVMLVNFVVVMLLFVLIKYWVFSKDREDADLLNEALKKRKQEQD